jgi:hypothetical protein
VKRVSEDISEEFSTIDIDFPSTSTSDGGLVAQECITPTPLNKLINEPPTDTQSPVELELSKTDESAAATEENISFEKIVEHVPVFEHLHIPQEEELTVVAQEVVMVPTAPVFFESSHSTMMLKPKIIQYPDLAAIRTMEETTKVPKTEVRIKPLSREQLETLYRNDRIQLAKTFEAEFIKTELSEGYRHTKHPLYEMLAEYSRVRHNLKIIDTDIELMRHYAKEKQNELWKKKQDVVVTSGNCCSGALVQVNHHFE